MASDQETSRPACGTPDDAPRATVCADPLPCQENTRPEDAAEPCRAATPPRASCQKKTTIGGQALIEGLTMFGPEKQAIAVREPSGEINVTVKDRPKAASSFNVPFLRGIVRMLTQLKSGMQAMIFSADIAMTEEEKEQESEKKDWFDRFADRHPNAVLTMTLVVSLAISLALFILLPSAVTDLIRRYTGFGLGATRGWSVFLLSLLEGVIRIVIFLAYFYFSSRSREMQRVLKYHGAEHKTIACYEDGCPLTVENVRQRSRLHPRCGTSFIFVVMIISILMFAIVGRYTLWINILVRVALIPAVAGISYELLRFTGSRDNALTRFLAKPGLALQRLTTVEPDDEMIEVAIAAMKPVIPENPEADLW